MPAFLFGIFRLGPATLPDCRQSGAAAAKAGRILDGAALDTLILVVRRLVLFVTVAALVAPWLAPCLMAAPTGHAAMACCHASETPMPAARPCCVLDAGQPGAPAPSPASSTVAVMSPLALPLPAILTLPSRLRAAAAMPRTPPRHLSTILLI